MDNENKEVTNTVKNEEKKSFSRGILDVFIFIITLPFQIFKYLKWQCYYKYKYI